jgi:Peptidase family C25/Secretion system C-terminal sorting domain/Propeptide_C25
MKNTIIIALILIINLLMASEIELNIQIEHPEIARVTGSDYFRLSVPDAGLRGEIGEPALPWLVLKTLLPPAEKAVSMDIEFSDESTFQLDGYLYPIQAVHPLSTDKEPDFQLDKAVYDQNISLPLNPAGTIKTESWHGYNIALSSFCPVIYNPHTNSVTWYKSAKITITTQVEKLNLLDKTVANFSPRNAALIQNYVANPGLTRLYPQRLSRENEFDLLIVSPEEFITELMELENFYNLLGRRVQYISTEFIDANLPGIDLQEKIRNQIIYQYSDYGISSVLLAGDVEHVPARGFYCQVQSSSLYEDDNIPADLYYSALDGTWNDDNDGLWGEPEEDDLLPEIAVARLPFSNLAELTNMTNKTLLYAQSPVAADLNRPMLAGELLWPDPLTWGGDYLDLLVGNHDDNGYETTGIPTTDDIVLLLERENGEWSLQDFLDTINQGTSFLHHVGHANYEYMILMHLEDMISENFLQLNGIDHINPLLYTHGCNCGGFDQDDCIAEEALKLPNFISGFIGNSRYGWFNEGQTEGPSQHMHREFVNALYTDKINDIAQTHLLSKIETAPWITAPGQHEEGALRWCFYDCNVLADPTLPIWTDQPAGITVNYPTEINTTTSSITIYVELINSNLPAANFRAALLFENNVIGTSVTDSLGIGIISIDSLLTPGSNLSLAVSGYNCLPQQYYISVSASQLAEDEVPESNNNLMNYPNPFNPETEITFELKQQQNVMLSIYSIKGQHIVTLLNKNLAAGTQSIKWNGKDADDNLVNSGVYFARLRTQSSSSDIKMLLLK